MKNSALENFAKFTGKHISRSLFFNFFSSLFYLFFSTSTHAFSCIFCKVFKRIFFTDHLRATAFFPMLVFFHEHPQFTGQQGKGEAISLTPLYHFHPLHRNLGISRVITAESSPLHIASSRTPIGNLLFPSAGR